MPDILVMQGRELRGEDIALIRTLLDEIRTGAGQDSVLNFATAGFGTRTQGRRADLIVPVEKRNRVSVTE